LPVAKVDGVTVIFLAAYIDVIFGNFENSARVKNRDRGETNVNHKSIELAGVRNEAISIALIGRIRHIGSHKFEPGGGGGKKSLVGDETVEFAISGENIEFGGKVGGDKTGRRGRGSNDLLGVIFIDIGTDNGVRGRDDTIVVDNATYKFVQTGREKIIRSSLINNYVGSINDELGKSTTLVGHIGTINGNNGLGDDGSIDDFGKVCPSPASTSGDN
jgi:hypothetical protein